jgi:hypothetical protein
MATLPHPHEQGGRVEPLRLFHPTQPKRKATLEVEPLRLFHPTQPKRMTTLEVEPLRLFHPTQLTSSP